jgi:ADP-ribosyl-[dinitrogen reductase] hydrolase
MNNILEDRCAGMVTGAYIADALAMPAHWYYDRGALQRDYGIIRSYLAPKHPHPDSILWRSSYTPLNERGDILREQAQYWGQTGVHYHPFLRPGENTLNLQLVRVLDESLTAKGGYDLDDYLERYIDFMLTPGRHRDTYVEEYHRHFFTQLTRGSKPRRCGGADVHIGGLAGVALLCARLGQEAPAAVKDHVGFSHGDEEVLDAAKVLTRMLLALMLGEPLRETILHHGSRWFSERKAALWSKEPDLVVVGRHVSPACYIRESFPASLYLAWKYADDFEAAVVANTMVGGDNCHRGAVVGALVGAACGLERLPQALREGLLINVSKTVEPPPKSA